jgi:predicted RNA binding protein YcfA (HicA-like mRNA interferase family)
MRHCAWTLDRQKGSHQIWYSPVEHYRISIQDRKGEAKSYQVKQFLGQWEKEKGNV